MNSCDICLECAEGGHLDEMMEIIAAFEGHDIFFITTKSKTTESLTKNHRVFFIRNSDPTPRRRISIFIRESLLSVVIFFRVLVILAKEKPGIAITTGGSATIQLCVIGKILGIRIISLQSITRVNSLSLTGKLIYPICDVFLVQWEGLLEKYPRSKFWGRVL